jgi:hypothetical protein
MPTYLRQRVWWRCVRPDAAPVIQMLMNGCSKPKHDPTVTATWQSSCSLRLSPSQRNGTAVRALLCYVQTVTSCIRLCIMSLPTMLHGQLHFQIALLIRLVLQPDLLAVLARCINFCMSMWKLLCVHWKVTKTSHQYLLSLHIDIWNITSV